MFLITTGRVEVEYVDPMQGIIRLTLDNDFLKASTDTSNFVNTQKSEFVKQVKDLREQMEGFEKQTETELTDYLNNINDKILEVNERLNSATEGVITEENLDHLNNYDKKMK